MPAARKPPASVRFCNLMIRAAAHLVPPGQREEWEREWSAEIWHRWQFLFHAGLWDIHESWRLVWNCLGVLPDVIWHLALQESARERIRGWARSPWTCLGGLLACVLFVALLASGLPATRQLIQLTPSNSGRLVFIWFHPAVGGPDRELPPDVPPAWASHSKLLESVAGFHITRRHIERSSVNPIVIAAEPSLFRVLRVRPALGAIPSEAGVVIDQRTWTSMFHKSRNVIGSNITIGKETYVVAAVLPAGFEFVTRRPSVFIVRKWLSDPVNVIARTRPGVSIPKLDKELVRISEDVTYYFFNSQLRMSFVNDELWSPVRLFAIAVSAAAFLALWASRVRWRQVRFALQPKQRIPAVRRALFFTAKLALALSFVFTAGLEWARSQSAVVFASHDPASGPLLLWLYILGAMGTLRVGNCGPESPLPRVSAITLLPGPHRLPRLLVTRLGRNRATLY